MRRGKIELASNKPVSILSHGSEALVACDISERLFDFQNSARSNANCSSILLALEINVNISENIEMAN